MNGAARALFLLLSLLPGLVLAGGKSVEVPGIPKIGVPPALPAGTVPLHPELHAQHAYGALTPNPALNPALNPAEPPKNAGALAPVADALLDPDLAPSQAKTASDADWAARVGEAYRPLDIFQIAAEAAPFVKTGGLADVLDGLPRELAAQGHRVTLVLPNYKNLKRGGLKLSKIAQVSVPIAGRMETADVLHARHEGVDVWLLDGALFNARDGPYAENDKLHEDNDERFTMLARAALEAIKALGRKPDIVHAHDWHAALAAPMLKLLYRDEPAFKDTRSVVTIHNIAYQGDFSAASALKAGFSMDDFTFDKLSHHGTFNFLKAGLQYADRITTVSPFYRNQTFTPEFGNGMEGLLAWRAGDYEGIINGLDTAAWAPSGAGTVWPYGVDDVAAGKAAAKSFIQRTYGLDVAPDKPLYVVLSRIDPQKGVDLVAQAAGVLDALGGQLFVLGGAAEEPTIDHLAQSMPGRFFRHAFDTVLPKLLLAAADFLLMPSRFEPCGLSQLQAQLMGALPIVTPTGGLVDTVTDIKHEGGDGIVIARADALSLAEGVARARRLHDQPDQLAQARRNAMTKDVSWRGPALSYLELFNRLVFGQPR